MRNSADVVQLARRILFTDRLELAGLGGDDQRAELLHQRLQRVARVSRIEDHRSVPQLVATRITLVQDARHFTIAKSDTTEL